MKMIMKSIYLRLQGKSLKFLCKKIDIPYFYLTKENIKELEEYVRKLRPDLIVVYSMSQLLKKSIIEIPKYGCINLHPSYLPKYRGPNPYLWQYFFDEKKFGVTLHFIDEGEDTGDIIYQTEFEVERGTKLNEVVEKFMDIGKKFFEKAIDNIENLPRIKQPKESPTPRAKNINSNEYIEMINKKLENVESLFNFLCGTENYFNKWINKSKFYYFSVVGFSTGDHNFETGRIIKEKSNYFFTAKNGLIQLKKVVSIKFFLKKIILGD